MHASDPRSTPSAEPNVIPMIDILLVLLIIFMVNIGKRYAFELQLPEQAATGRAPGALRSITIHEPWNRARQVECSTRKR